VQNILGRVVQSLIKLIKNTISANLDFSLIRNFSVKVLFIAFDEVERKPNFGLWLSGAGCPV